MAGKETPKSKPGEKVTSTTPETVKSAKAPTEKEQEILDHAPVLEQREYIVDGNTAVLTRDAEQGTPRSEEEQKKVQEEASANVASTHVEPISDVKAGLVEEGGGNPSAHTHQSGPMAGPVAEGDPDSIRAWNARHAAEDAFPQERKEAEKTFEDTQAKTVKRDPFRQTPTKE